MNKKILINCQRGIALPVVLWIFLLLSLMFSGYAYSIRTETAMTRQVIELNKTRAAAEAGVEMAVARLLSADEDTEENIPAKIYSNTLDGINLRFAIMNESGRVDLNTAPEELLRIVLQTAVSSEDANYILDSLLDWRDSDHERRVYGAEDGDYISQGLSYEAADTSLKSVDELMLIQGMTPELFRALRGMVTVHSETAKINLNQSPAKLLLALAGMQVDAMTEISLQQEAFNRAELIEVLRGNLAADLLSTQVNDIYNIEVEASMPSGTKSRLSVIIRLVDTNQKPYTVLWWEEVEKLDFIL